jgi:CheY-like chemotaxis protein
MTDTVLYVEDNDDNIHLVKRILKRRTTVDLVVATTGRQGLQLAQDTLPRLILLDRRLPDIHGNEVLRQLKSSTLTANIPVVMLSGDTTSEHNHRNPAAGRRRVPPQTLRRPATRRHRRQVLRSMNRCQEPKAGVTATRDRRMTNGHGTRRRSTKGLEGLPPPVRRTSTCPRPRASRRSGCTPRPVAGTPSASGNRSRTSWKATTTRRSCPNRS